MRTQFRGTSATLVSSLLALTYLPTTNAVYADEAYSIDYARTLLGVPQSETTFFHRPRSEDAASLLYTISDVGVLGAVKPGTGDIVWRQWLGRSANGTVTDGDFHVRGSESNIVSATGGKVQCWNAISGVESWNNEFEGAAKDLEILESVGSITDGDVLVLFQDTIGGGVLRRLNGHTGDVVWEHSGEHGDIPVQVSTNVQSAFVVTLHGVKGGYNLRVTTLDPLTGKKLDEHTLTSKADIHEVSDVLFVGANTAAPIVAWAEKGLKNLNINILGTKKVQSLPLSSGGDDVEKIKIHAPRSIQSQPHFLVHSQGRTNNWAEVYHIDILKGLVSEAYHLPKLPSKGAFSTSEIDANVYFTRTTADEVIIVGSTSHAILGRWPMKVEGGKPDFFYGVSEAVKKSDGSYAVRAAVVTSENDWVLIVNGVPAWSRVEGLTGIVAAAWAEVPEEEELARTLAAEAHSNPLSAYIHRVNRHLQDLQDLPGYLLALPHSLLTSILPGNNTTVAGPLARDKFGFRKLVITATERGQVYAIDAGDHGKVVWSKRAYTLALGEKWDVKGIFVDDTKRTATIRGSEGEYIIVETSDGKIIETMPRGSWPQVQSTALVDTPSGPWLLTFGKGGNPGGLPIAWAPNNTLVVIGEYGEVKGLKYVSNGVEAEPVTIWTFSPPAGNKVISATSRPVHDPVASIGRVLSDRTVLYKYLNPNIFLVTAVSESSSTASFYLLDSISGEILYSTTHYAVDIKQPIVSVLTENWFVYSLFSDIAPESALPSSKGYQLIVSELYESSLSNDRGPLGAMSNYSVLTPSEEPFDEPTLPHVKTAAFLIPEPISHISVSQTLQGITTRALLLTLAASDSIISIPRAALDPRRPVGRAPTAGEMEEGLSPYSPFVDFDPKFLITHKREIIGVKDVITSPSLLESTSLVFAYGIDVFGTRIVPSGPFDILGKGFNKLNLVLTVVGLAFGVGAIAPMVRRKQINLRWKMG